MNSHYCELGNIHLLVSIEVKSINVYFILLLYKGSYRLCFLHLKICPPLVVSHKWEGWHAEVFHIANKRIIHSVSPTNPSAMEWYSLCAVTTVLLKILRIYICFLSPPPSVLQCSTIHSHPSLRTPFMLPAINCRNSLVLIISEPIGQQMLTWPWLNLRPPTLHPGSFKRLFYNLPALCPRVLSSVLCLCLEHHLLCLLSLWLSFLLWLISGGIRAHQLWSVCLYFGSGCWVGDSTFPHLS